jgi:serine/threonine protein kinase
MSPEALMGADMTPLSDQYSLGVVLYECATGINPFVADTVVETARRVTTGDYPRLSEQAIRPSRRLSSIIERAMSVDPSQRFPDMRALGQELLSLAGQRTRITWSLTFDQVAAAVRAQHALATESTPAAIKAAPRTSKAPVRWPLAAAATLGLVALISLLTWPTQRQRTPFPSATTTGEPAPSAESVVQPLQPTQTASLARARTVSSPASNAERPRPPLGGRDQSPELANAREPISKEQRVNVAGRPQPRSTARASRPARRQLESPDWLLVPRNVASVRPNRRAVPMGTNEAPIFD